MYIYKYFPILFNVSLYWIRNVPFYIVIWGIYSYHFVVGCGKGMGVGNADASPINMGRTSPSGTKKKEGVCGETPETSRTRKNHTQRHG